jgi:thioredoxin reductase (NADPH)
MDRPPFPFETNLPGALAVADMRHGFVKRVAGAMGQGSVAIGAVHQHASATPEA